MPTKKIADAPKQPCKDPSHYPPTMRVFEPGVYEHTCPACGQTTIFTVSNPTLDAPPARRPHVYTAGDTPTFDDLIRFRAGNYW